MTTLRHKGCGGQLLLDISGVVGLLTPSYNFRTNSVGFGTVELSKRTSAVSVGQCFSCSKCSEHTTIPQIEGQCVVCRKYMGVPKLFITDSIPLICGDCLEGLSESPPEKVSAKVTEYRNITIIPKSTRRKSLSVVLSGPLEV